MMLTLTPKGKLHEELEKMGITTFSYVLERKNSWVYFYKHARYLAAFCRKNKVDTVWSHLQESNVIAVLAQPFLKAKLVPFRHHDESTFHALYGKKFGIKRPRMEVLIDRFINRFAKRIVVLSNQTQLTLKNYEGCDPRKIIVCPLIYDFTRYPVPDQANVEAIRQQIPAELRLIMISRMIESKQHLAAFRVFKKLKDEGLSIKMIVTDDGPLRPQLEKFIQENNLGTDIIMTGYRTDLTDYMEAVDLLVHPSLTEASNNVVKEMGWHEKTVAVCEGVGDFDDYIKGNVNGFILNRSELELTVEHAIREAYSKKNSLVKMGQQLKKEVLERFSDTPENKKRYLELV